MNRILAILLLLLPALGARGADPLDIWEGTACDARVRLTPHLAGGKGNTAVVVCPGGSYFWLDRKTEGHGVAEWLRGEGISAFVLEYRVAGVPAFITHFRLLARGNRYPDMLADVQRSIQIIREHADEFGIDPQRIGVMGFSAGGHLSAMSGMYFDSGVLAEAGVNTDVSVRPDFVAPVYPVVTMTAGCVHKRSRRGLLGEGKAISREMKDSMSLENHVRPDMPPVFLVNCKDDPVVKFRNSELLDSALTRHGVPHRYLQYSTGGHGFGADSAKTTPEAIAWKGEFLRWLADSGFIPNRKQ